MDTPNPSSALESLLGLGHLTPERLDEVHGHLQLLGVVIGQLALLDVATAPTTDKTAAPKVAAARALMALKESPEALAERLRRSPFAELRAEQLQDIVHLVQSGVSLQDAVIQVKQQKEQAHG